MIEKLLTAKDLAKRWSINVQSLNNWRLKGRGPAFIKLGEGRNSHIRYREADVLAFEEKHWKETTE